MVRAHSPQVREPSWPAHPAPPPAALRVHAEGDPQRAAVEAFIRTVYARRYGAQVRAFAPLLVSLCDDGGIVAAAGYRHATEAPLFLERYLCEPVERLVAAQAGSAPNRGGIVEVGHLAAVRADAGRQLIRLLAPHLATEGCQWVVGTLTGSLRRLVVRLGITPLALAHADPARLGDDAADWGSYYAHAPLVLAGHLPQALRQLGRGRAAAGTR